MIWTLLAFLCVLATKFLTSVRLRGLKARLDAIQPHIDELRVKLAEAEEQLEALKLQVGEKSELINALQDVVRQLEESRKQPMEDAEAIERVQLMETVAKESTVI
ncbi:MAG: hypothetical protein AB1505_37030 [Candidatus Latescibacterota bacterium]